MRCCACLLIVSLLLTSPIHLNELLSSTRDSDIELKVGKPFPTLILPSLNDGEPASISQFRGKKLILHIFASW